MSDKIKIKEIFTSIQGEGPYVGVKQLFIRFCGCNLSCKYCDTDFNAESGKLYTIEELLDEISKNSDCHSVSLTGGEPLLHTEFLKKILPSCSLPIYLETNATLPEQMADVINYVDYISADIKIPSCTGDKAYWNEHNNFFSIAMQKETFAKVVFDDNITDDEIDKTADLCAKYNIELILQPKCTNNSELPKPEIIETTFNKFLSKYKNVRLVPQVHKFLNIR